MDKIIINNLKYYIKMKASKKCQRISVIEDKQKRINQKSKRTRTLIRKAIEVSQMCNLDIYLVVHDKEYSKVIEYNSVDLAK